MIDSAATIAAALLIALCGAAVGATSIGGVLVVPVLTGMAGIGATTAVAAASFGFAFCGAAALVQARRAAPVRDGANGADGAASVDGVTGTHRARCAQAADADVAARGGTRSRVWLGRGLARHRRSDGRLQGPSPSVGLPRPWLGGGALTGAAIGALTLTWLPVGAVQFAIGLLCLVSGAHALAGARRHRPVPLPGLALALLGLAVGCLSAWSGTGGPVVLLPLLALLGWPVTEAVQAAQRIQLPVALAATAVNIAAGRLDWTLGVALGVLLVAGWAVGRRLAGRLPTRRLQQAVAVALIAVGAHYL